jgi:hypothetical protein
MKNFIFDLNCERERYEKKIIYFVFYEMDVDVTFSILFFLHVYLF